MSEKSYYGVVVRTIRNERKIGNIEKLGLRGLGENYNREWRERKEHQEFKECTIKAHGGKKHLGTGRILSNPEKLPKKLTTGIFLKV